jgi:hypothetical protein
MTTQSNGAAGGPAYEVVWPLGRSTAEAMSFGSRMPDLNGKTIAEVNDFEWGESWPIIRDELKRRYPDLNIVEYPNFGPTHQRNEREVVAALPEKLRRLGVDAVISGNGV